jgi:ribosomal protein S27E
MKEYLNKKVEIREKVFSSVSSTCIPMSNSINTITGTITNIYDEFIEFKCLDCGKEVTLEAEIVFELFEPEFEEYPALICNDCSNGTIVPKDLYEELLKKHKRKHR